MVRAPYFDKHGMKKGQWSEDEDNKLRAYIEKHGHTNWRYLPKDAGLSRCGKSCRLRWMNYLRPGVKHGNFTREEEDVIALLHKKHGNKWSMMAARIPGRSDNEIKNHWHTRMKNQSRKDQTVLMNEKVLSPQATNPKECLMENHNLKNQREVEILLAVLSSEAPSSCSTRASSSCSLSVSDHVVSTEVTPELSKPGADFWTSPLLLDNDCVGSSSYNMFSPFSFADDLITKASYEDYITDDMLLW